MKTSTGVGGISSAQADNKIAADIVTARFTRTLRLRCAKSFNSQMLLIP
jgi:hypothetical protein